ncbi:hypothetical protein PCANC_23283 [Puccinia coronata f. sp. avenae]|uniref:Uncharacterized protein n=1 Tax=Puccinia coronata f. sp. avenae TaxID=200324 RepID=A0A2N5TMU0_9BASI|nr:hypothetical protein PCANC_23283 [Puccinia coronata f. sp. avenae]
MATFNLPRLCQSSSSSTFAPLNSTSLIPLLPPHFAWQSSDHQLSYQIKHSAPSTSNKKKSDQSNQLISSESQLRNRITRDHTLDNVGVQTLLTRITDCP